MGSLASWCRVYCLGISTDRVALRMRRELYNRYLRCIYLEIYTLKAQKKSRKNNHNNRISSYLECDVEFFDQKHTGELMTVIDKDVARASDTFTTHLAGAFRCVYSLLLVVVRDLHYL